MSSVTLYPSCSCNIANLWADPVTSGAAPNFSVKDYCDHIKLYFSDFMINKNLFSCETVTKWAFSEAASLTARLCLATFRLRVQLKFTKYLRVNPAVWIVTADWWMWLWTLEKSKWARCVIFTCPEIIGDYGLFFVVFLWKQTMQHKSAPHRFNTIAPSTRLRTNCGAFSW